MAWYQLFFQFAGIAEATIQHDDWAWLRAFARGDGDLDRWIEDLARPGALTASQNWARANLAPRMPARPPELPPVKAQRWASGQPAITSSTASASANRAHACRGYGATSRSTAPATGSRWTRPGGSTTCFSSGSGRVHCPRPQAGRA
jgi:hypothetical protein